MGDGAASSLDYLPETVRNSCFLAPASLASAVAEKGSKRVRIGRRQMPGSLPSSGKFMLRQGTDHWDLLDADSGYLVLVRGQLAIGQGQVSKRPRPSK